MNGRFERRLGRRNPGGEVSDEGQRPSPRGMKIHNTMTRTKEELVPLTPGEIRMYSCGVTVYDLSHVGHARMLMVFDVISRYLRFAGYRVTFVRNFTDIDDKIIRRAGEEGVSARELSERNIAAFREDMAALGVLRPEIEPKATEHVPEMIGLIGRLVAGGHAYVVDGDVYFEVRRFPAYGKLSGKNLDELQVGARVEVDERKRDPRDFALWKSAKPGEPAWDSPWGPGRPGWHIECSAMSVRYLGESFDIHGGGEDLIFPHHECEIAQTEADTGKPFARYWVHNAMVNMGREKMSKSLGNTLTIRDLVTRHDPAALRLFLLGTHYRTPLEWSEERVEDSARALERLWRPIDDAAKQAGSAAVGAVKDEALPSELAVFRRRFIDAMDDDFNTPEALGVLFDFSRALRSADIGPAALVRGAEELKALAGALGLQGPRRGGLDQARIERLIEERTVARRERNFKRADEIRAEIEQLGAVLEDKATGTVWRWKGR
jgi:cysteinyl-tRNA synthetase